MTTIGYLVLFDAGSSPVEVVSVHTLEEAEERAIEFPHLFTSILHVTRSDTGAIVSQDTGFDAKIAAEQDRMDRAEERQAENEEAAMWRHTRGVGR
jgi:hypothetical protein